MRKHQVNLLAPPNPSEKPEIRVHLALSGPLAERVHALMARYGLEQSAVVRMLIVDGLEARDGRLAS